ncbi:MAG: hypothetical protein HGN29_11435 [Asgard group archaeon]|nr:hypothetical protein [Asgard group archaeon]
MKFFYSQKNHIQISFLLIASLFLLMTQIPLSFAAEGIFVEDFTTTNYINETQTNVTGWGTGEIQNTLLTLELIGACDTPGSPRGLFIAGDYAYIADEHEDLKIVDISDPTSPNIVATGSFTGSTRYSVVVDGNYAYVAGWDNRLVIFDVTDPENPVLADDWYQYTSDARNLVISGDLAFVADFIHGLCIYNITDPTNFVLLAEYPLENIIDVEIAGNFAYIANFTGVVVMDISNPLTATEVGFYETGFRVERLTLEGDYLFLGCLSQGFHIANVTDPLNPTHVSSYINLVNTLKITIDGDYAYVCDHSNGLQIFDITDLSTPLLVAYFNDSLTATSVVIQGNYAYVSDADYGLKIFQIYEPITPIVRNTVDTPGASLSLTLFGDYAFIADDGGDIQVLDISNPLNPQIVGTGTFTGSSRFGLSIQGNYLYVANMDFSAGGLVIFNITDPKNPVLADEWYQLTSAAMDLVVSGDFVFVADSALGLCVFNITNPHNLIYETSLSLDTLSGLTISGNYIYAANSSGMIVVDISNPLNPQEVSFYDAIDARMICVDGDYAYLATGFGGMVILNITDPLAPSYIGSYATDGVVVRVYIDGPYAFLCDSNKGLFVLDISNPSAPSLINELFSGMCVIDVRLAGNYLYVALLDLGIGVVEYRTIYTTHALLFNPLCIAQSAVIYSTVEENEFIDNVIMTAVCTIPTDTSLTFYVSGDNATNWEIITLDTLYSLINDGHDLVWKAVLETTNLTVTPTVTSISLEYETVFLIAEFSPTTVYLMSSTMVLIVLIYITKKRKFSH